MRCPYKFLPSTSWWSKSVAGKKTTEIDTQVTSKFKIKKTDKIASAGSCFAEKITTALKNKNYNYFITEEAPEFIDEKTKVRWNYGTFSARYGNVYTCRQLLQLLQRSFKIINPKSEEIYWEKKYYDPLRPFIQPNGFPSLNALLEDRKYHLKMVKKMFQETDIFIFTMGLTESWVDTSSDLTYPVCPGCSYGEFHPNRYSFVNSGVAQTSNDLDLFISKLKEINPHCKIILTVSPVPLIATMSTSGVARSTTYSKSVLRCVAEEMVLKWDHVDYFSSYEVITGTFNNKSYYSQNKRHIEPIGVNHVMKLFFRHFTDLNLNDFCEENGAKSIKDITPKSSLFKKDTICDEEKLNLIL